jgi:predicted AlkP superfamily phosphohydrolase/phosphomutase
MPAVGFDTPSGQPRVLILALDAAEPSLLRRWADDGTLPAIKSLLDAGAVARLRNPPGLSGATWPTLNSGKTAASHARYYYSQLGPRSYRTRLITPKNIDTPPFWARLAALGKRVVVVDIPKTHPVRGLSGIQIVDWANHDGDILDGFLTWPAELQGRLDQRFGPDPFGRRAFGVRGPSDFDSFVRGLCANVERKGELIRWLMRDAPWDLFFASWDDCHWAGHFGWRLHDVDHPHHDPRLAASLGDPVKRVLEAADASIAKVLAQAPADTSVVLLASHGMGPGYRTCEMLDPILRRLEGGGESTRRRVYGRLRQVWDRLPGRVHRPLAGAKNLIREGLLAKDRARRRWFAVPSNNDGGSIRINLVGRDPQGKVQPGDDYDACCAWLMDELKAIEDADSGRPIVREVYKLAEHMRGPRQHQLPDLTVEWDTAAPVSRVRSPRIGELAVSVSPWRSGEHLPDGLMIVHGAGIRAGAADDLRAEDFAPSVAALLGLTLADVDGRAVAWLAPQRA